MPFEDPIQGGPSLARLDRGIEALESVVDRLAHEIRQRHAAFAQSPDFPQPVGIQADIHELAGHGVKIARLYSLSGIPGRVPLRDLRGALFTCASPIVGWTHYGAALRCATLVSYPSLRT